MNDIQISKSDECFYITFLCVLFDCKMTVTIGARGKVHQIYEYILVNSSNSPINDET